MGSAIGWMFRCAVIFLQIEPIALSAEKRLIKNLLDRYNETGKVGRPVYNTSDTIHVQYGLALIQILDLDEKNQVLTTNCWSRYIWKDILLQWNPDIYGGVVQVRVPTDKIWTPDIVLYNYADDRVKEQRDAFAVVSSDGTVLWIPQAIFKSSCVIDITHFPFDSQQCFLKFGSWTYDGYKLDVSFFGEDEVMDLNDYIASNEWKVIENPAEKNVKYYPCCKEPYPDLTFRVKLRRKVAFYNYILVLPCILLASLTLVLFWLPPESPAKIVLGMNIFVGFFVLLLLLADSTPRAATNVPLIGAYYCLNMIMITLSTFLSVIVINLYFRGDKRNKVPMWVRKLFIDFLARALCMRSDLVPEDFYKTPEPVVSATGSSDSSRTRRSKVKCPPMKYNKFKMHDLREAGPTAATSAAGNPGAAGASTRDDSPLHVDQQSLELDVHEIRRFLRVLLSRINNKADKARNTLEWRIVALVLDRIFFFMYLIANIVALIKMFPKFY